MYLEDFKLGQKWQVSTVTIERDEIIRFAKEYDPMRFHLDEEYSKDTRFGGLIASGVQVFMRIWAQFMREHDPLGNEVIAGMSNHMHWPAPTYPGDQLSGEIEVLSLRPRNPYNGVLEIAAQVHNQNGILVMTGGAEICVKRRPA
jgi:acyl dehydratase